MQNLHRFDSFLLENVDNNACLALAEIQQKYYTPQSEMWKSFKDGDELNKYNSELEEAFVKQDETGRFYAEVRGLKVGYLPIGRKSDADAYKVTISGGLHKSIYETDDGNLNYEMENGEFSVLLVCYKQIQAPPPIKISPKNHTQVLLMAIFLGFLGIHRFAVGKTGTGVLWLLTLGLFGIGWFVDVVWLLGNCFDDYDGAVLVSEKGKVRIAARGYGAERNGAPEVFCWFFIGLAVIIAIGRIALTTINGTTLQPFMWFCVFVVSVCYPVALAWIISEKGLD